MAIMQEAVPVQPLHSARRMLNRAVGVAAWAVLTPFVVVLTGLGAVFLYFSPLPWAVLRVGLAATFVLAVIAAFVALKPRVKAIGVFAFLFAGLAVWYSLIPPSSDALLTARLVKRSSQLMPTPNIYASGEYRLFEDLAPELQTTTADLLYVTDRAPEARDGSFRYGYGRSTSLAFGSCLVEIGHDLDWATLVAESTVRDRTVDLPLIVRSIVERGRLASTPLPLVEQDGEFVNEPAAVASQMELIARFHDEIRRRLAFTPVHEAFLYVHGYQNSFDYAAGVVTEFWHFGGRVGVPILYSWPAGSPGLLKGYNHDRESGEFTILHLKQLIRALSQMPELRRIHVIAHSRGTDVAASALRELVIEERGGGRIARDTFKLGQVILASPDIDLDVVFQRFEGERFFQAAEHITIYVSREDRAIGMAEWLYRSRQRLGKVRPEDLSRDQLSKIAQVGRVDIVDARVETGFLGHSYYHSNPAVSSDLILLLRYGAAAGSPQRPLRNIASRYWVLEDEAYPGRRP